MHSLREGSPAFDGGLYLPYSQRPVTAITAPRVPLDQTPCQRCIMPILFMALIALGTFMAMGLMLFYAAYCEVHEAHHPHPPAKK